MCVAIAASACTRTESGSAAAVALSPEGAQHGAFAYSHDGGRIAFWKRSGGTDPVFELWVANADMSDPVKLPMIAPLSFGLLVALWSPDDSLVAAASSQYGGFAVTVAPSTGGEARRLTYGTGTEFPVAWQSGNDFLDYQSTVGGKGVAHVVNVRTGESMPRVPGETRSHIAMTSPGGRYVAIAIREGDRRTICRPALALLMSGR
jgi:hypothetical protein